MKTKENSIKKMYDYGYLWQGMLPLDKYSALQLFDESEFQIYLLYENDTESLAVIRDDIVNHDGIFGVE